MKEDEIKQIQELLLNLDSKLDRMMDNIDAKLDRMMMQINLMMEKLEIESKKIPKSDNISLSDQGSFLKDIDGKPQLFSWETKDFFNEEDES